MLEIESRYYDGHEYRVKLQESAPDLLIIPMRFDEDLSYLSDSELMNRVLERFYRERFEAKFMREAVDLAEKSAEQAAEQAKQIEQTATLIIELTTAKEEYAVKIQELNTAIDESKKATEHNNELIKQTVMTMNMLISSMTEVEEDEEVADVTVE